MLIIIITAFFLTYSYYSQLAQIKSQRTELLYAIAGGAASGIDGELHQSILNAHPDSNSITEVREDSSYFRIHDQLNRVQSLNKLSSPLYTLVYDYKNKYFQYVVRSDNQVYYLNSYKKFPKALLTNYEKGGVLEPYETENGEWISAYYPIRDADGHVTGLVQADEKFEIFINNVNSKFTRFMIICILFILCMTIALLPVVSRMLSKEEKVMKTLKSQKFELERVNADLSDSVKYASSMQRAISPPKELFSEFFEDHFVLNMPKDVVSGDFYWMQKNDQGVTLVVSDCTGHGVPGAMMSMMGISMLNSITQKKKNTGSGDILNLLDNEVDKLLYKSATETNHYDGMDISVLKVDLEDKKLSFSAAMSGIYHSGLKGDAKFIRGDRFPIGGKDLYEKTPFVQQDIPYQSGKWVYLFSDGYQDQFGHELNKKFTRKRFFNLLQENVHLSGFDQLNVVKKTILDWKGNSDQIDDILVVGIKLR